MSCQSITSQLKVPRLLPFNTLNTKTLASLNIVGPSAHSVPLRFARNALCTALASSLGLGLVMMPAIAADVTTDVDTSTGSDTRIEGKSSDIKLNNALDALRLKKAVEQGIIDKSVLDDYIAQSINNNANEQNEVAANEDEDSLSLTDEELQQQVTKVQQQGYQMLTPEQIERELSLVEVLDDDSDSFDNDIFNGESDFDAPIATLDSTKAPIGLDISLDETSLSSPTNLDTLNNSDTPQSARDRAQTAEIMARPIQVSDAVGTGRVDPSVDINQQINPKQALASQQAGSVIGAKTKTDDIEAQINAGIVPDTLTKDTSADVLNPDDYLPDYQVANETQAVSAGVEQASKAKPSARNSESFIKRAYNRLFNGGAITIPHIESTVYLQQATSDQNGVAASRLIKADEDSQPMNNIKAALDDTSVQSVVDFTAALPKLRQSALDAAKAVGYYDIALSLRQPTTDTIDVIIERLGEPVRVDSRIVDIRGEGIEQIEFKALEQTLPPNKGDIFNHRVYKNSKAALESLSNTYGYFDQYWLNKSVDIILPDNTADVSLVYNTGDRYEFDEVVFFTFDKETGTLTRDPDKLPVELPLLKQLLRFDAGDPFFRPDITKFTNDLSATRYFNTVNVETILPPDGRSANSTLAFNNAPANASDALDEDVDRDDALTISDELLDVEANAANNLANADNITGSNASINDGPSVDEADIAPIKFEVDEQTSEKLQAIKQKAIRLTQLPNNRVLDEKAEKAENILGKISDSISGVVKKIFPDEEKIVDENYVAPTLANRITPEQVFETKKVPLYVFVASDKPRDAQVGLGYGTDSGVRATAKIDYNLLNRQGYQAGAAVELSRITKGASVYGSRPWKHPLNDKLEARLTYEEEVINQGKSTFDVSTQTLKAALARNIRKEGGWNRSYSVKYRLDELDADIDVLDLEDAAPIAFINSSPTQQALLFGYGMNKTDVDNAIKPTRGIRQYYSIEAGSDSLLSETNMAILKAGVSGLYSFGADDKHQVLGRFNTGYIWADNFNEVPYKLRFFAGGDQSIRGYDFESLSPVFVSDKTGRSYLTGGQILAVGSAEYNYEFRPGFRGAVFSDIGNAYDKDFETETKVGVGVGIRWASPIGTVRVDVAAGVSEESIPIRLLFFIGSPL